MSVSSHQPTQDVQSTFAVAGQQTQVTWRTRQRQVWSVGQIVLNTNSTTPSRAFVFQNSFLVCSTRNGNNDVASNQPSIVLLPGNTLTIAWDGLSDGAEATATIYYTVWQ